MRSSSIRSKISMACFRCSLPCRPYGHRDGRGMADMFGTPDMVRRTAKPSSQACPLIRWIRYHCSAVPPVLHDQILLDVSPFLKIYRRIERLKGTDYVPASLDAITGVNSKDVMIYPDTGVSVRLYLPKVEESSEKKLPVLVYFHGGAFIIESTGSPHYHKYLNLLAAKAGILIVSVNYRLAPEHPLPAAYDDSMAAFNWVVSHSAGTGEEPWLADHGDFTQLFLSGDSAGGNITHYVAMRADDRVSIEGVALVHPYFYGSEPVGKEIEDPANMLFHSKLWKLIAPDSEGLDDPQINPWGPRAPSLKGLNCKRAVVFVAGNDFHADRGRMYHEKLVMSKWEGKEPVCCDHDGVGHVFHLFDHDSETSTKMMTQLIDFFTGPTN